MPWLSPKFPSIHIKLTKSSAMSNLFRFIAAIALVLAAADYFFSVFAALIDLFPSLPTLLTSYIFIFSLIVVCAHKLFSALPKLFKDNLGGLFFSVFAEKISSRIISWIIDHFPCFNSNGVQKNEDQINSSQMNGGKLNDSQSSEGQINGDQGDTGHSSGGQMNGVQMNGGEMKNGKLNCIQISGGQSSRVQLNGVQMNGGRMTNGQLDIKQSKVTKANIKYNN